MIVERLAKEGHKVLSQAELFSMTKDELISRIRMLEMKWDATLDRCDNQSELLKDFTKYTTKYRWHDLRRNPEDLPEYGEKILVVKEHNCGKYETLIEGKININGNIYDTRDIDADLFIRKFIIGKEEGDFTIFANKIVAWKEIEPFEEDE